MASSRLRPHPTLGEERVLALLSPRNLRRLDEIKASLGIVFPRLDVVAPDDLGHLGQAVSRSRETHKVVIAVGGDGTLHQVLQVVDPVNQVLALLPGGTGNDFARAIGYKDRCSAAWAAERMLEMRAQPSDLCLVNGIRFHNSAGFGLDTATVKVRERSKGLLHTNYVLAFLAALKQMQPLKMSYTFEGSYVSGDGRHISEAQHSGSGEFFWVLGMNNRDIGGGTQMAPLAKLGDGVLDLVLIHGMPKLNMLSLLPAAMKGRHLGRAGVDYAQCASLRCVLEERLDWLAVDGEMYRCGEREVQFELRAAGLTLLR